MAAITTRLIRLRPTPRPHPLPFSSSTPSDDPQPDPETTPENKPQASFSSYLSDVKATLQNRQKPQSPRLDEIRRNLSQFRQLSPPASFQPMYNNPSTPNFPDRVRQMGTPDSPYLNRLRSLRPNASAAIGGGGVSFPNFNLGDTARSEVKKLFKSYKPTDLGKKLQDLRPQKREGEWFSFQELSDRLARLKKTEEKQSLMRGGSHINSLRESLLKLQEGEVANDKLKIAQKLETLRNLGGTPSYMLHPPKEELVEQYFHPDNMSAAEKMKLELKKVRDEFKMSESDCGSTRVQIAQLTTKIKYLSTVLAKKDKHSRKGLHEMVQQRKKLLKYLRRTDWDSYCFVLSKLGLRDNPPIKA